MPATIDAIREIDLRTVLFRAMTDTAFRRDLVSAGSIPLLPSNVNETAIVFLESQRAESAFDRYTRVLVLPPVIDDHPVVSPRELEPWKSEHASPTCTLWDTGKCGWTVTCELSCVCTNGSTWSEG